MYKTTTLTMENPGWKISNHLYGELSITDKPLFNTTEYIGLLMLVKTI